MGDKREEIDRETARRIVVATIGLPDDAEGIVQGYIVLALMMARREEREACASLVEVQELIDPSGMSSKEQVRIYSILAKVAQAIREQEG